MFQIVSGDLLYTDAKYICHQVNCCNVMGAGIAKTIYSKWPKVKAEYHQLCNRVPKLDLFGQVQFIPVEKDKTVVNIFSQFGYGHDNKVYTNYTILSKALLSINDICAGETLAFPYGFGCGLAGGDWMTVEKIMLRTLYDCNVKICFKD